jgi:hypothetical protein
VRGACACPVAGSIEVAHEPFVPRMHGSSAAAFAHPWHGISRAAPMRQIHFSAQLFFRFNGDIDIGG